MILRKVRLRRKKSSSVTSVGQSCTYMMIGKEIVRYQNMLRKVIELVDAG